MLLDIKARGKTWQNNNERIESFTFCQACCLHLRPRERRERRASHATMLWSGFSWGEKIKGEEKEETLCTVSRRLMK